MEFASSHIYAYDESDEEDLEDLEGQTNPLYMTFGADNLKIGENNGIYDNAGRMPPQVQGRNKPAQQGIYDNAGRMPPDIEKTNKSQQQGGPGNAGVVASKVGGQGQGDSGVIYDNAGNMPPQGQAHTRVTQDAIYDNRPVQSIPTSKPTQPTEEEYAYPYDFPRDLNLYQDVKTGRPPPPSNPPPLPPANRVSVQASAPPLLREDKPPSQKIRRADTNVIAVNFEKLVKPSSLHANRPIYCVNCGAVFSRLSKVTDQIWRCEFCDQHNQTKVSLEDLQQKEDTTFVLQPPSESGDETAILFCMDVSGSMSVTTEVLGDAGSAYRQNDMAAAYKVYQEEVQTRAQTVKDEGNPYVIESDQNKNKVSYISRLQAMQTAIDQQLGKMQSIYGNKRVGLIAFNDMVTIIGDGTDEPMPLEGASLTDKDTVISLGCSIPLPQPISEVRRCLSDKVFSLVEGGQTALGPSLLMSTAIASQKAGSKVIICTDGKANVGLGNLDGCDDETYEQSVEFYDQVGDYARDAGVCVSVLTVEGEDCRAIELGNVADKTGGKVTIVDPLKMGEEFASILDDNILATNVSVKLALHTGLYIRDEEQASVVSRNIGNVTKEMETTFEFGVRVKEVLYDNFGGTLVEVQKPEDEPIYDMTKTQAKNQIEGLERLPFQLQVRYTDSKGGQYLRVITMDRPVTKDRHFAEQNANVAVIGAHAAQTAAKLAVDGNYNEARINALVTQKLVERHVQSKGDDDEDIYQTFVTNMAPIQSELQKAQTLERHQLGHSLDDIDEEDEDNAIYQAGEELIDRKKRAMTKKQKQRRKKISDHQANLFYKMKNATSKMFQSKSYSMAENV